MYLTPHSNILSIPVLHSFRAHCYPDIHTDYKSLTHFLIFDLYEGIYSNWVNRLRKLNFTIQYISNHKNKIADDLFKIVFEDFECAENNKIMRIQKKLIKKKIQ